MVIHDEHGSGLIWRRLLIGCGFLFVLWAAGFVWFAASLPRSSQAPEAKTDAIVVLTGGSGRVEAGVGLLAERRARKLFVSGVYRGVEVGELVSLSGLREEDLSCCIQLGYEAESTRENAQETARWMKREGFGSLRLVTAAYHMPRSLLEFRRAMPKTEIIAHPVFSEHFRQDDWWRWPGSFNLILTEYSKFLLSLTRGLLPNEAQA